MDEMAAAQSMSTCRKGKCILQCSLEFAEEGKYSSFFRLTFYIFLSLMGEIEAPLLSSCCDPSKVSLFFSCSSFLLS